MKAETGHAMTRNKKSRIHQPTEIKVATLRAWTPQPNPLSREEIRKHVINQIG
ncbi:hypothetical protein [Microvirga guangxiensis]|uniref:Uncharacterized protein n=1 Tax=Microvirga guangxiensis TaxID=549386 RepID=A0A1G5CY10_9HYPH|nr:hypothetical protein [Microvirga guangxiensis]SCY07138.1 hypothetical protein SAMN02927923_00703 [Microvirga guangxiensis]